MFFRLLSEAKETLLLFLIPAYYLKLRNRGGLTLILLRVVQQSLSILLMLLRIDMLLVGLRRHELLRANLTINLRLTL